MSEQSAQKRQAKETELVNTTDALVWATYFCERNSASDISAMLGWFANAIEAGRSAGFKSGVEHARIMNLNLPIDMNITHYPYIPPTCIPNTISDETVWEIKFPSRDDKQFISSMVH